VTAATMDKSMVIDQQILAELRTQNSWLVLLGVCALIRAIRDGIAALGTLLD